MSWSLSPDWSTGVLAPTQVSPARKDECRWPATTAWRAVKTTSVVSPGVAPRALFVGRSTGRTHETLLHRLAAVMLIRSWSERCSMIASRFAKTAATSNPFARNSFSHTRNRLREIEHLDRAKQCFARVAAPVMTLPSDQTILNERYRKACRRKLPHSGHTAHPAAYDDHVEFFTSFHLPSLPMIGTYSCVWVRLKAHPLQRASSHRIISGLANTGTAAK